jgi:hypothetical protein
MARRGKAYPAGASPPGGFAKVPETTVTVAPAKAAVQGERLDF